MSVDPSQRRAARHAQPGATEPVTRRVPITVERITEAALQVISADGYDALTIRSVAKVLGTGPSSLYAHIVNRADIDDLLIGWLSARIVLPEPDPARWREQLKDVYAQLRDQYLRYPGVSRAALAVVPTNLETLRVGEGLFAIALASGADPRTAAWAVDALSLYVVGYALETSLVQQRQKDPEAAWILSRDDLVRRLEALPADRFPQTRRYAAERTSGDGHERFDFTLDLFLDNLYRRSPVDGRGQAAQ
ncbi:TetR/AcrR family transcriptional regulator C-terminal domain-containing protein [Actinoplanes sp. LDG1-06]|uniref:TetR/AcrR family transcriptional regulator C-terminal domain-containing protein n=1 Tax=Paractinoplanes ovalisporus TaxID=2810368 RepID=A0ABS2ABR5_9ACTN|nr:TetR/AcrR family transcriptional regulator [Actinoplanes ovalisporus]MBM2617264.1 TetR/AcrR family transcriptional regulator C-terminal domain-containing protein [Actinoplanes ovalisporus]